MIYIIYDVILQFVSNGHKSTKVKHLENETENKKKSIDEDTKDQNEKQNHVQLQFMPFDIFKKWNKSPLSTTPMSPNNWEY